MTLEINRSAERWCPHHAAHRGSLNVPALTAGSRVERNALTPRAGTRSISVVNWLNESSSGSFYLLKLEAVRIGESDKAPLLTLIVGPTPETRGAGSYKRELTEHHQTILEFWKQLLEPAFPK